MQPLVSIIITSYNYSKFLRSAIESTLNQSYQNIEIIVVDDGSTDESPEVIKIYDDKIISVLKKMKVNPLPLILDSVKALGK